MAAHTAYLGLGSNIGNRKRNIRAALRLLALHPRITIQSISSLYVTSPVGPAQNDFINAAVKIRTSLAPRDLLSEVKTIEQKMGRVPAKRWGPRIIDLDILMYGNMVIRTRLLRVPHPRMHDRLFVLEPLAEIAPLLVHPVLKTTIRKMKSLTGGRQKVTIVGRGGKNG